MSVGEPIESAESFVISREAVRFIGEPPPMWTNENRARYDRDRLRYPSDLTDAEWAHVEPLIPPAKRGGNRRHVDEREVVNGLMYVLSTGCQWRAVPKDLPPRSTLYDYFDLLELGRHARSHPRRALREVSRNRRSRGVLRQPPSSTARASKALKKGGARPAGLRRWQECAPRARITYGGRFHPESCRLVWKLTSGSVG